MNEEQLKQEATLRADNEWKHDLIGNFCQIKKEFKEIKENVSHLSEKVHSLHRSSVGEIHGVNVVNTLMFIYFVSDMSIHMYKLFT